MVVKNLLWIGLSAVLGLSSWLPAAPSGHDAAADFPLTSFRYARSAIMEPGEAGRSRYTLPVDPVFYEVIDDLAGDLRMVLPDGRFVPFVPEKYTRTARLTKEEQLAGKIIGSQTLPDGRRAIDFELESEPADISAIELVVTEPEFQKKLTVAVGDGSQWTTALNEWTFVDYHKELELTSRRIQFPKPLRGKLIRLIFGAAQSTVPEEPLHIEVLRAFRQLVYDMPGAAQLFNCTLIELSQAQEGERTVVIYRSDHSPLAQIKIHSSSPLYQRRVTLSGSDNQRSWTLISGGTIRKIDMDSAATVDFPESRYKFYKLEIYNGSAAPLENLSISALSTGYQWVIPGEFAADKITVYYGAKAPSLPDEWKIFPDPGKNDGRYRWADPAANPLRKTGVADQNSRRWLIGAAALGGTLLMLLYLAWRLPHEQETLPRD